MSAPFNDLLSNLEAALKSVLDPLVLIGTRGTTADVAVAILTGLDDDEATLPRIVCYAHDSSEEMVRDSGLFRVRVLVHIYSHAADETLLIHRARVATVSDALMTDDRAAVLSAAVDNFHCYELQMLGPSADPEGHAFHTGLEFSAVCCAANLS